MHDKFEKEVQNKMEELRLTPSAPVWEKIEMEIRPENKRRRVFFWLFFGLLLTGAGTALFYWLKQTPSLPETTAQTPASTPQEEEQPPAITEPLPGQKEIKKIERKISQTPANVGEKEKTTPSIPATTPSFNNRTKATAVRTKSANNLPVTSTKPTSLIPAEKEQKQGGDETIPSNNITEATVTNKSVTIDKPVKIDSTIVATPAADSLAAQPANKIQIPADADSSAKKKAAKAGWKKQLLFSGGFSSYENLSGNKSARADGNLQSAPGTAAPVVVVPSPTQPGAAFSVGFSFARQLNDHWEIGVGLKYAYYSTRTKVGSLNQNDTTIQYANNSYAVDRFYTNNATAEHTNQFHVAEVPVTITYQPLSKLPLLFSVSAAYGRLLATNAVSFSSRNNVYFENGDDFNRQLLPVAAAAEVQLFRKKRASLRLGPVAKYNLIKLKKQNPQGDQHLFFAGIQSSINF